MCDVDTTSKCPVMHGSGGGRMTMMMGTSNQDWWPKHLNNKLKLLSQHQKSQATTNPMSKEFDYVMEFQKLDLRSLKKDLHNVMTDSQDWWPADYGHYGPFFIRMAWHSAGTYRIHDGRGGGGSGQQRFAPLNSWPDNGNLDKARRLLWPIKQKYGKQISWADLMILAGNVALESMGFTPFGFAGGREDVWEPEEDLNWGYETTWLGNDSRYNKTNEPTTNKEKSSQLDHPFGAVQMGLIYVNPEGPNGKPDPKASAYDIRETFGRMAMNDEETVALVAGGHTFGKCHGAADPSKFVGSEPEGASIEEQGLGWSNKYQSGMGSDTITSGLEGAWTAKPTVWDNGYFHNLFSYEWELTKSPAGAYQWKPKGSTGDGTVPDAHLPNKTHPPMMSTADMALRIDPIYERISRRFYSNPNEFKLAFAKAWYKLTHRDMGPYSRCLGPEVAPPQLWQDPIPSMPHGYRLIAPTDAQMLKEAILGSGLSITRLITTAWASASTFRNSDKRGGANGGRIRLTPQKDWHVNEPMELANTIRVLERIQQSFNNRYQNVRKYVSIADLIVLGGCAGVEAAAKAAGHSNIKLSFTPGRMDATQEMTDVSSFTVLEPMVDGFRNYRHPAWNEPMNVGEAALLEEALFIDKAQLLSLTAPEMTALIGGFRVLGIGTSNTSAFTKSVGQLTNDFFINLLDMGINWTPISKTSNNRYYIGRDRTTGTAKWTASRIDLIFGSNSILRSLSEVYASKDGEERFVKTFCNAFVKVMDLDRYDIRVKHIPSSKL